MTGERRWKRRWAVRLTAHAARVMPDSRSEWAVALSNELDSIEDDHAAFLWAAGAVTTSYRERLRVMRIAMTRTFLAASLGVVHGYIAVAVWGYLAAGNNPVAYSLIPYLTDGHETAFWVATGVHDAIVNVIIALPFAALLFARPGMSRWKYAAVAGAANFVLLHWDTFTRFGMSAVSILLPPYTYYSLANAAPLLSLPIAFAAVRAVRPSRRPS